MTDTIDVAALVERVVRDFSNACTDWDGSQMADGEEPRFIPNCGYMREIATALQSQAGALAEADAVIRRTEYSDGDAEHWRGMYGLAVARAATAEAALATMREALEPFAEAAASYDPEEGDDAQAAWAHDFTIGSLRRARRALGGSNAE